LTSTAHPAQTPAGVHELVRRWEPAEAVRAELVLCHGLAEHSGRYEHVGDRLAAAGIGVTSYDQIGFGASGGRRAWVDTWPDVLDQIQRHVENARATGLPVVLLGHSNGGLFALAYALSERPAPDVVVVSAPMLHAGAPWQRFLARILAPLLPRLQIPNRLDGSQLSRDPAVGEAYLSDPLNHRKTTLRYGYEMLLAMEQVNDALHQLDIPTLVLHGAADTIVPPQASAPLSDIPGVERRLYPALRHEIFNEPEGLDIVDELIAWIDNQIA
jgi:acylglycerol lipase